MSRYELWYADALGNRIAYVNDVISFEYAKVLGDIGIGAFQIPRRGQIYDANKVDRKIHIYRQPSGGSLKLDFSCYLRRFSTNTTLQGQRYNDLTGVDSYDLLARRIVASYAGSDDASASAEEADDLMKRLFWQQMGTSADTFREITPYGFTKAGDTSLGPQITKGFAWRNVLAVMQDVQADSKALGNEVFFGLVEWGQAARFTTWINQPGVDLTNKVIFSLERGNLSQPRLTYDHLDEANYIYAGGSGQQSGRIVEEVEDQSRSLASPLNLREKFRQSQGGTSATVASDAQSELELSRPRINFSANILDTPMTRYGRDWNIGDRVTVDYAGLQLDTLIRSIRVRVDARGKEDIQTRVEYVG